MTRLFFAIVALMFCSCNDNSGYNQNRESYGSNSRSIQEKISDAKSREVYCKDLMMVSEHVNFFAREAGWNGEGFLPELSNKEVWQQIMDARMVQYYENTAPVCSYCLTGNTAQNWGGLAYCNAANQYSNVFLNERYQSVRFMDRYIQEQSRK